MNILKSAKGAIDLASIMVGVLVIGLIGGVIAATVFAVIPWAQDSAAKHQLVNIQTAQSAQRGLSVEASGISSEPQPAFISGPLAFVHFFGASDTNLAASGDASFGNLAQLQAAGLFTTSTGVDPSSGGTWDKEGRICVASSQVGDGSYDSAVVSDSGRTFIATFAKPKPSVAPVGATTCLGAIESNGQPAVTNAIAKGVAAPTVTPAPTAPAADSCPRPRPFLYSFHGFSDLNYNAIDKGTKGTYGWLATGYMTTNYEVVVCVDLEFQPYDYQGKPVTYRLSESDKALIEKDIKAYYEAKYAPFGKTDQRAFFSQIDSSAKYYDRSLTLSDGSKTITQVYEDWGTAYQGTET